VIDALTPLGKGLLTGYSLIIAIGAQNAFVLSQGLQNRYPILVALVCSLVDVLLITMGIAGMGALISGNALLLRTATLGGALFLAVYGLQALCRALRPQALQTNSTDKGSAKTATVAALAVSLLNPHVYLDTIVLLGSIGGQYPKAGKFWFGIGAALASLSWFFSLSLGAQWLAPILRKPVVWRVLDVFICLIMWGISTTLVMSAIG
jgi:L-lysine exporter family protein LysE/ArgO